MMRVCVCARARACVREARQGRMRAREDDGETAGVARVRSIAARRLRARTRVRERAIGVRCERDD